MQMKIEKSFCGFCISAFELVASNARFYWLSGVNMVRKSLKISYTSRKMFMGPILFESDQKISQKHCRTDLSSVSDPVPYWPSISVLIRVFLGF